MCKRMNRFFVIVLLIMTSVMGLSAWALGSVLPSRWLGRGRAALLAVDLLSLALFYAGVRGWIPIPESLRRAGIMVISMLWTAQLMLIVLVVIGRLLRGLFGLAAALRSEGSLAERFRSFFVGDGGAPDPERRRLLFGAAAYPVAAAAAGLYGGIERMRTVIREIEVPVEGIDDGLAGFRIAQISDVHLGLFYSLDEFRALLEKCAATGANALAVTGDVFDNDAMNREAVLILDSFVSRFPQGILFCYGNHEHFRKIKVIREALAGTKIRVLNNAGAVIREGVRPLYFAGVDFSHARSKMTTMMDAAMKKRPEGAVTVLLAHHPDYFDEAAKHDVELALAGHTHGGQLGLFGVPLAPPIFKYMRGVYHVGPTFGYVHCGNGSWFPYRFGCPPEIAVFTLRKA